MHVVGEVHKSVGGISQSVKINLFFATTVVFPSKKQNNVFAKLQENIYRTTVGDVKGYYVDGRSGVQCLLAAPLWY